MRLLFLRRAFAPQLFILFLAVILFRSLDPKAAPLSVALDRQLGKALKPSNQLRIAPVALVAAASRLAGSLLERPLEKAAVLWVGLLLSWYLSDIAISGRRTGWQLIAPHSSSSRSTPTRVWAALFAWTFTLSVVPMVPFLDQATLPLPKDLAPMIAAWRWEWSALISAVLHTVTFVTALIRQRSFASFELHYPTLEKAWEERRARRLPRLRRKALKRQLTAFFRRYAALLRPVYTDRMFRAAVDAATGEHLSAEEATQAAAQLQAKLEQIMSHERERVREQRQDVERLEREYRRLVEEVEETKRQRDKQAVGGSNLVLLDENLAASELKLKGLRHQIADLQVRFPDRI